MNEWFRQKGKASKTEKQSNKVVEGDLKSKQAQKVKKNELTLLLLGTGESGKTTIFKQLRFSRGGGFDDAYFDDMKNKLCANVIEPFCNVLENMAKNEKFRVDGSENFDENAKIILDKKAAFLGTIEAITGDKIGSPEDFTVNSLAEHFDQETFDAMKYIWSTDEFQAACKELQKNGKYNIPDTYYDLTEKLLESYPAWGGPNWKPNKRDILLARVRTTGFNDQRFEYKGSHFRLIDVGGQRSERKKWIYMFDGVPAVIFVAALSEYDQTLYEDGVTNRVVESLKVFRDVCTSPHFKDSAIVLFLNKVDLFDKKFRGDKVPLKVCPVFSDAPEKCETKEDRDEAIKYIESKYKEVVDEVRQESLFMRATTALDSKKMETVFEAIAENLLYKNLRMAGILT